ncbi:MAG: secondary thiamine-phosphate synthase enzyme YjbQ [Christensenellaceae bacterium]
MIYNERFQIQSDRRPTFDDITFQVKEIANKSGVKNGTILVYTGHTTCSLQIQEFSDGKTYWGTELIMQDLVNVLMKIVPTCTNEGQYLHPCQNHVELAARDRDEHASWCLNTDAHLRSVIMGRSVIIPIVDGEVELGEFGCIYFGDWDQVRARLRTVLVQVQGE